MAQEGDDAAGELVLQRCRLQTVGLEVRTPCSPKPQAIGRMATALEDGYRLSRKDTDSVASCRADDLIPEESDAVLLALKRLPPKEAYDRVFRLRRAFQVNTCALCSQWR